MNHDSILAELRSRCAYLFSSRPTWSIPSGWLPEFEVLCGYITAALGDDKGGVRFKAIDSNYAGNFIHIHLGDGGRFVREMRGGDARFVFRPAHGNACLVEGLVAVAEEEMRLTCMVCGQPASTKRLACGRVSLCREHEPAAARDPAWKPPQTVLDF